MLTRRVVSPAAIVTVLLGLVSAHGGAVAQTAVVRVERENFRSEPAGSILAVVVDGTELEVGEAQGNWRPAVLEGWMLTGSVEEDRRYGHDLSVTPAGGENLRSAPDGRLRAWLRPGMRLDRMEVLGAWVRVRREGWIWEPSLSISPAATADTASDADAAAADAAAADAAAVAAAEAAAGRDAAADDTAQQVPAPVEAIVGEPAPDEPVAGARDAAPGETPPTDGDRTAWAIAGRDGLAVLDSPAGDSLARLRPGAAVQVVAREGSWTRVRVEGWTRTAALGAAEAAEAAILEDVDPAALRRNPQQYRGRLVAWNVQFVALQQAERFRSDFMEGEAFLLARGPGEEPGFVYAAVPPSLLEDVRKLTALERVRVVGRVRTVRSSLTGAPVLDLLELRPVQP